MVLCSAVVLDVNVCVCVCWLVAGVPGATLRALGKVEIPDEATLEDLKIQVELLEGEREFVCTFKLFCLCINYQPALVI